MCTFNHRVGPGGQFFWNTIIHEYQVIAKAMDCKEVAVMQQFLPFHSQKKTIFEFDQRLSCGYTLYYSSIACIVVSITEEYLADSCTLVCVLLVWLVVGLCAKLSVFTLVGRVRWPRKSIVVFICEVLSHFRQWKQRKIAWNSTRVC